MFLYPSQTSDIMSYPLKHTADSINEKFVSTMPCMTELSSTIILAETDIDMNIFDDVKHPCSWYGLSPDIAGLKNVVVTRKQSLPLQG